MPQIRHISTSSVCPTRHNDESTHQIELTPRDLPLLQLEYIQKGLLFRKPADKEVNQNLIQHLKASLSCTLNIFYPLAGRLSLVENQENTACFFINCNGVGAHFVHAAVDGVRVTDFLYVRASEGLAAFSQHFHSGILSNTLVPTFRNQIFKHYS